MSTQHIYAGKPKTAAGGVYVADTTAPAPVDAKTALDAEFSPLGRVSPDGLTRTIDRSTTDWRDWSGSSYRTITSEHSVTYSLTFLESTYPVLCEVFGTENVTQTGTLITVAHNSSDRKDRSWVFEMADGDAGLRECVPFGQITEAASETVFNTEAPVSFTVTITAHEDEDGNKAYSHIEENAFAPAA